jgi:hypothetical protein
MKTLWLELRQKEARLTYNDMCLRVSNFATTVMLPDEEEQKLAIVKSAAAAPPVVAPSDLTAMATGTNQVVEHPRGASFVPRGPPIAPRGPAGYRYFRGPPRGYSGWYAPRGRAPSFTHSVYGPQGNNLRDRSTQCFYCHGWGHTQVQCPSINNYSQTSHADPGKRSLSSSDASTSKPTKYFRTQANALIIDGTVSSTAPPSAAEESLRNEHIGEYDQEQLEYYEFIDYPAEDWSFEPQM